MNSKDVGNIGEHLAILELLKLGITISRPLGDNARYDLIIEISDALFTVQVKSTASSTDDTADFMLQSSQIHRGKGRQSYDVDYFILVDINKNKVFILENKDKTSIKIRYTKPLNNQSNFNWWEDFLLINSKILNHGNNKN